MGCFERAFAGVSLRGVSGHAVAIALTLSLGACAQFGDLGLGLGDSKDVASATDGKPEVPQTDLQKATAYWGKEAGKNPKDGTAALNYARNLKAMGRKPEALAVLEAGYLYNAEKTEFVSEYGRLALDLGHTGMASQLLERADDPTKPDWRVTSARGTVLAKQGQYKEAIPFFERAIEMAPSQSSVQNNLAMAYAMDGQAEKAEELLRQAQAAGNTDPRVKQNLALILNLQGKKAEAAELSGEAPPLAAGGVVLGAKSEGASVQKASASGPMTAPLTPITTASIDADQVIRAALAAEEAKKKAAAAPPAKKKKAAPAKAAAEDAPSPADGLPALRASAR